MKTSLLTLLFSAIIALSAVAKPLSEEGEKVLKYTFALNKNAQPLLRISHQYGLLKINRWDKNEIYCETTIKAKASSKNEVKKLLDEVMVNCTPTNNICNIETRVNFEEMNDSRWVSIEIQIFMPENVQMDLKNRYGNIYAVSTRQPFTCNIKYGDLFAENLNGKNNRIEAAYGHVTFADASNLDVQIKYGSVNGDKVAFLQLNSAYSNVNIREAEQLKGEIKYGDCNINQLKAGLLEASYSTMELRGIQSQLTLNIRYGSCQVEVNNPLFSLLNINASYTPVDIFLPPNAVFETDLNVSYGDIKLPKTAAYNQLSRSEESVSGKVGSGNTQNRKVIVSNQYNHISLH